MKDQCIANAWLPNGSGSKTDKKHYELNFIFWFCISR